MGSISIPTAVAYAAAAASVAGAGYSAYESHQAGVAASDANKQKARVEADKETANQINMRQKMLTALAAQNAQAGAGGGDLSKAGALRQITQAQNDIMVSKGNSSAQVSLLDQAASNARAAGDAGAVSDVLSGVSKLGGVNGR